MSEFKESHHPFIRIEHKAPLMDRAIEGFNHLRKVAHDLGGAILHHEMPVQVAVPGPEQMPLVVQTLDAQIQQAA